MQRSAGTEGPLVLDPEQAVQEISTALQNHLAHQLKRRGFVVAMSGGIDSSACAALAVRAVGSRHVFGLFLPERESDPQSRELALTLANQLGIQSATESIDPILEASGCFKRRNDAIRRAVPDFKDNWGCKLVLPDDRMAANRVNVSSIVVQPPGGGQRRVRLGSAEYREVVAASNFKQRVRTMLAYFHADRLHYAVVGTPNRLEYDQGFFVKGGDGLADVKPIAHLYKTQVYQIARHLGVPEGILTRPPTTDTFSLPQSQEEFYFSLPAKTLDQILHALNAGKRADEVAREIGLSVDEVQRAYADIAQKRATTIYLHLPPLLVKPVLGAPGAPEGAH